MKSVCKQSVQKCGFLVVRLLILFVTFISFSFSSTYAEDLTHFTKIGVFRSAKNSTRLGGISPEISPNGSFLAANDENDLQVWALKNGNLDRKVWASSESFPKALITSFAWCGSTLLISKVDNEVSKPLGQSTQLSSEQLESMLEMRGNTVLLDPVKKTSRLILNSAYRVLFVDVTGQYVSAATPTTQKDTEGTVIDFFRINVGSASVNTLGHFRNLQWPKLLMFPYIIGWLSGDDGILLVGPSNYGSEGYRQILVHIDTKGKLQELLPTRSSILPSRKSEFPVCVSTNNNSQAVFVTLIHQSEAYLIYTPNQPLQTIKYTNIEAIVSNVAETFKVLSLTPNGRFVIVQDYGKDGYLKSGQTSFLWVVDLKTKRRHKMISLPEILSGYQWSQNSLLVDFMDKEKERNVRRLTLLTFDLAALPADDLKIDKEVAGSDWEGAPVKVVQQPVSVVTASKFLQEKVLASVKLPSQWSKLSNQSASGVDKIAYALGALNQDNDYVVVDTKKNRVVEFNTGLTNTPQAPEPITPEKAISIAREFVSTHLPEFQAEIKVEFPITIKSTYLVHLRAREVKDEIAGVDVEVQASDGKIAAYRELTEANIKQKKPSQRPRPPAIRDFLPRFSVDGNKVAFYSNRPRTGYPLWWSGRPNALYMADADGTNLQVVAPNVGRGQSQPAQWSPDGRWLAYFTTEGIFVYDAMGKKTITVPAPWEEDIEPKLWGWLSKEKVLLGWMHNGPGGDDLVTWDVNQPEQRPQLLVKNWSDKVGNDYAYGQFALSPDSKTLAFTWRILEQNSSPECSYSLYTVPTSKLTEQPKQIVTCLPESPYLNWGAFGLLVAGVETYQVDPLSSVKSVWEPPNALLKSQNGRFNMGFVSNCDISKDGKKIAYAAYVRNPQKDGKEDGEPSGSYLLHITQGQGEPITIVKAENPLRENKN